LFQVASGPFLGAGVRLYCEPSHLLSTLALSVCCENVRVRVNVVMAPGIWHLGYRTFKRAPVEMCPGKTN
jgi:hypothetical protein